LLFTLLQQWQDLHNLKMFSCDGEPEQLLLTALNETLINKRELAFLAQKHPNELNNAIMAEHEYLQAIDALSTFNEYTRPVHKFCRENAVGFDAEGKVIVEFDPSELPAFKIDSAHKSIAYVQLTKAIKRGITKNKEAASVLQDLFKKQFPDEHFWKPQEKDEGQVKE
jgi:hypothetical protein